MEVRYLAKSKGESQYIREYLHEKGFKWLTGANLNELDYWEELTQNILFFVKSDKTVTKADNISPQYYRDLIYVKDMIKLGEI